MESRDKTSPTFCWCFLMAWWESHHKGQDRLRDLRDETLEAGSRVFPGDLDSQEVLKESSGSAKNGDWGLLFQPKSAAHPKGQSQPEELRFHKESQSSPSIRRSHILFQRRGFPGWTWFPEEEDEPVQRGSFLSSGEQNSSFSITHSPARWQEMSRCPPVPTKGAFFFLFVRSSFKPLYLNIATPSLIRFLAKDTQEVLAWPKKFWDLEKYVEK